MPEDIISRLAETKKFKEDFLESPKPDFITAPSQSANIGRNINHDLSYNFDISKFDPALVNFNDLRAFNQSNWDIAANDLLQMGETFVSALAQGVAATVGLVGAGAKAGIDAATGQETDFMNDWLRNPIMNTLNEWDMAFKDGTGAISAPVYFTEEQLKNPMNAKSIWNGLANGVGFLASAFVPMGIIGKAAQGAALAGKGVGLVEAGTGLIQNFGRISKALGIADIAASDISAATKFIGKIDRTTDIAAKLEKGVADGIITADMAKAYLHYQQVIQGAGSVAGAIYSRLGESAMESYQSYDAIKADLISKKQQGIEGYANLSEEDIDKEAQTQANNVFGFNMALAPLEYIQFRNIVGSAFGIAKKETMAQLEKGVAKTLTKGERWARNTGRVLGTLFIENEEEGYQYGLQEAAKDIANNNAIGKKNEHNFFVTSMIKDLEGLGTQEGQLSRLLGAILGGGSQVVGNIRSKPNTRYLERSRQAAELYQQYNGKLDEYLETPEAKEFIEKNGVKDFLIEQSTKINNYTKLEMLKNLALEKDDKIAYNRFNEIQQTFTVTNKILDGEYDEYVRNLKNMQEDNSSSLLEQLGFKEAPVDEEGNIIPTSRLIQDAIEQAKKVKDLYTTVHETSVFSKLSFKGRQNVFYNLVAAGIDNRAIKDIDKSIEDIKTKSKEYYNEILTTSPETDTEGNVIEEELIAPLFRDEYKELQDKRAEVKKEHEHLIKEYKEWESNPQDADFKFLKGIQYDNNEKHISRFVKNFDNGTQFKISPTEKVDIEGYKYTSTKGDTFWIKDETGKLVKVDEYGEPIVNDKGEKTYWKGEDISKLTPIKGKLTVQKDEGNYVIHPTDKTKLARISDEGIVNPNDTLNIADHHQDIVDNAKDKIFTPARRTYEKKLQELQDEKSVYSEIISDLREKLSALINYGEVDKTSKEYKKLKADKDAQLKKVKSKEYLLEKEIEYFKSGLTKEESIAKAVDHVNSEIQTIWSLFHTLEEEISPKEVSGKIAEQEKILKQAEQEIKDLLFKRSIQGVKGFLKLSDPRLQEKLNQLKEVLKLYRNQYNDLLEQQQFLEKSIATYQNLKEENAKLLKDLLGDELVGQSTDITSAQEDLYSSADILEDMVQQQEVVVESTAALTRLQSIVKWFKDKIDRLEKFISSTENLIKRNEQLIEDIKYNHPIFSDVDFRWISSSELEEARLEQPEVVIKLEKLIKDNVQLRERVRETIKQANDLKDKLENYTTKPKEIYDVVTQGTINYLVDILNEIKDRIKLEKNKKEIELNLDGQDEDNTDDKLFNKFEGSAQKSITQMSTSTTGQHFDADDRLTHRESEKRFFKWADQFDENPSDFKLKVVTYAQNPEYWQEDNNEVAAIGEEGLKTAVKVIVGKVIDGVFTPIDINNNPTENRNKQIYTTLHSSTYNRFRDVNNPDPEKNLDPKEVKELRAKHDTYINSLIEHSEKEEVLLNITSKSNGIPISVRDTSTGKRAELNIAGQLGLEANEVDLGVVTSKKQIGKGKVFARFNGHLITLHRSLLGEQKGKLVYELLKQFLESTREGKSVVVRDSKGNEIKDNEGNTISIAAYLHKILYYGEQTKLDSEGKVIVTQKDTTNNIYIKKGNLYLYDEETGKHDKIPATLHSFEQNKTKIEKAVENTYHHVLSGKKGIANKTNPFYDLTLVDGGIKLGDKYNSYQEYLINSKAISTNITLFEKDNINKPQFMSTYLNFDKDFNTETEVIEWDDKTEEITDSKEDEILAKYKIDKKEYIEFKKYLLSSKKDNLPLIQRIDKLILLNLNAFAVKNETGLLEIFEDVIKSYNDLENSLQTKPKEVEITEDNSNDVTGLNAPIYIDTVEGIDNNSTIDDSDSPSSLFIREEANNPMNLDWEKKILSKILKLKIKTVGKLINGISQGTFSSNDLITLYENAAKGTLVHEAFHKVFRMLLTNQERAELYADFKNNYEGKTIEVKAIDELTGTAFRNKVIVNSEISNIDIEEYLADKFSEYLINKEEKGLLGKVLDFIKDWARAITDFIGFTQTTTYEKLFKDIAKGEFLNIENGDILEGTANSLVIQDGLSNVDMSDLMQDMTNRVIGGIFADKVISLEDIGDSSKEEIVNKHFERYYKNIATDYTRTLNKLSGADYAKAQRQIEYILNSDKTDVKDGIKKHHSEYLKRFGLHIGYDLTDIQDNADTIQDNKDFAFNQSSVEFSAKQTASKEVKILLASLPVKDNKGNLLLRADNKLFRKIANPSELFNFILDVGSKGITDIDTLFEKLEEKARGTEFENVINTLRSGNRLNVDAEQSTKSQFFLQQKFTQAFAKTKNTFMISLLNKDGKVNLIDATESGVVNSIKATWRFNLNANKSQLIQVTENKKKFNVIDKVKFNNLFSKRSVYDDLNYLYQLGIRFTNPDAINKIIYSKTEEGKELRNTIEATVEFINEKLQEDKNFVANDVFGDEFDVKGRISKLVEYEVKTGNRIYDLQHLNPEGKTVYSITLNNYLSTVVNAINNSNTRKELIEKLPQLDTFFTANSQVLNNIVFDEKGNKKQDILAIIFEGIRQNKSMEEGVNFDKLTKPDRLQSTFNNVLKGVYTFIRASSKTLEHGFKFGEFVSLNKINSEEVVNIFKGYLEDELNLQLDLDSGNGSTIKTFNKKTGLGIFNDILDEQQIKDILTGKQVDINGKVSEYINKLMSEYKQTMISNNLITDNGTVITTNFIDTNFFKDNNINYNNNPDGSNNISVEDFNKVLRFFTINNFIGNYEQTKLFTGNLAFYENVFKRNAAWVGTKKISVNENRVQQFIKENPRKDGKVSNGKINTLVLDDIKSTISDVQKTFFEKHFIKRLAAIGITNPLLVQRWIDTYMDINKADASGLISMDEYREFKNRMGEWGDKAEEAWQKIMRGEKDVDYFFPPIKAQYAWHNSDNGLDVPEYYKFALVPILPNIGEVMPDLAAIAKKMENKNNQIGIVLFASANKVGRNIKDLNLADLLSKKIDVNNITQIDYRGIGIQVDIAAKIKNDVTKGTQEDKLIYTNLFSEGEISPEFMDLKPIIEERTRLNNSLYNLKYETQLNKFGLKYENGRYNIENIERLKQLLTQEAVKRDLPKDVLASIDNLSKVHTNTNEGVNLNTPLDVIKYQKDMQNIIHAILRKTVKYKKNGLSAVQVPHIELNITDGKSLEYIITKNEDGSESIAMEVLLPNRFKGSIKIGDVLDNDKFEGVAFRIPTQALASIDKLIIKGFLPAEQGDVVFVPNGITSKTGSDYDVDKLNIYLPYTKKDSNGNTEYLEYYETPNNAELENLFNDWFNKYINTYGAVDISKRLNKLISERNTKVDKLRTNQKISWAVRTNLISKKVDLSVEDINDIYDRLDEITVLKEELNELLTIKQVQEGDDFFSNIFTKTLSDIDINLTEEEIVNRLKDLTEEAKQYKEGLKSVNNHPDIQKRFDEAKKRNLEIAEVYKDTQERIDNIKEEKRTEFNSLSIENKNGEKRIENKLLEIEKKILGHEANIGHLLTPNTDFELLTEADFIAHAYDSSSAQEDSTDFLKNRENTVSVGKQLQWNTIADIADTYLQGKGFVGAAALQLTNLPMRQIAGIYIKQKVNIPFNYNKTKEGYPSLSGRKMINGGYISDIYSTFVTGFVDIENNPFIAEINANGETLDVYFYLTGLGVDKRFQTLFMNQPILKEYVEEINRMNSEFYSMKQDDIGIFQIKEQVYNKLKDKYSKIVNDYEATTNILPVLENYTEEKDKQKLTDFIKFYAKKDFSTESEKNRNAYVDFARNQLAVLENFKSLKEDSANLFDLVDSTKLDTEVIGKSIVETQRIIKKIDDIKQSEFFGNTDKLFEDTIFKSLEGIVRDSVNVYAPLFLTEEKNSLAKEVKDKILKPFIDGKVIKDKNTGKEITVQIGKDKLNKLGTLVQQDFANFILTAFESTDNTPINSLIANLMIQQTSETVSNKTIPQVIYDIKNQVGNYSKAEFNTLRDNGIIKELMPNINSDRQLPDNLRFNNRLMTAEDTNMMVDEFLKLYNLAPNLALNIFKLSMLQTGLAQNPITLFNTLPTAIYNEFLKKSLQSFRGNTVNFVENFYNSFHQNNWKNDILVPQRKYSQKSYAYVVKALEGREVQMFANDNFIKVFINGNTHLMKKVKTTINTETLEEKNYYKIINKLGVQDYTDQHFLKENNLHGSPVSVLYTNNVPNITNIPVYEGITYIDNKKEDTKAVKENKETKKKYTKKENKVPTADDKKFGAILWNKYKTKILAKHNKAKAFDVIQRVANKGYKNTEDYIIKCY